MRRIIGTLVALVIAVSLVLIPVATVSADLGKCTGWDKIKWENNVNSWKLYLEHWGRTPTSALSHLAGLCGPDKLCKGVCNISNSPKPTGGDRDTCLGGCSISNIEAGSLGTSCTVANNSLDPATKPTSLTLDDCPASLKCPADTVAVGLGTAKCAGCWGKSLAFANKSWGSADLGTNALVTNSQMNHFGTGTLGGGDWGITGSAHPECVAQTWALQNNLLAKCKICK